MLVDVLGVLHRRRPARRPPGASASSRGGHRSPVQAATCASSASWWREAGVAACANRGSSAHAGAPERPDQSAAHSSSSNTAMATQRSSPSARVHAVRRGVRVLEPVARRERQSSRVRALVDRDVEHQRADQLDAGLHGRHVDVGAHAGRLAGEQSGHEQRGELL